MIEAIYIYRLIFASPQLVSSCGP